MQSKQQFALEKEIEDKALSVKQFYRQSLVTNEGLKENVRLTVQMKMRLDNQYTTKRNRPITNEIERKEN